MKISTTRFGEIEANEKDVYCFSEGLLGFAGIKLYFILNNPKGGPFQWLQAIEIPSLAFVVADPTIFKPDYKVSVTKEDLKSIELDDVKDGFVMVILTIRREPYEITANLKGPLVFNPKKMLAKQLVLVDPQYNTKHLVFKAQEVEK